MRDTRFIAKHRGGPLSKEDHRLLAAWAADCAERVLEEFETRVPGDLRPRSAIDAARAWSRDEIPVGAGQKAAIAAHAAAREAGDASATWAARAAGHAAATAHAADHSLAVLHYIRKVRGSASADEREWQILQVPPHLRALIVSGLEMKRI